MQLIRHTCINLTHMYFGIDLIFRDFQWVTTAKRTPYMCALFWIHVCLKIICLLNTDASWDRFKSQHGRHWRKEQVSWIISADTTFVNVGTTYFTTVPHGVCSNYLNLKLSQGGYQKCGTKVRLLSPVLFSSRILEWRRSSRGCTSSRGMLEKQGRH